LLVLLASLNPLRQRPYKSF